MRQYLMVLALASVSALPACKDDGASDGTAKGNEGARRETVQPKPVAELFVPGGPALPPPLKDLVLGEALLQQYNGAGKEVGTPLTGYDVQFVATELAVRYPATTGKVNEVELRFAAEANAEALATKAWGPPMKAPDSSGRKVEGKRPPALYWFSKERGLRVRMTEVGGRTILNFARYMPLETFMGKNGQVVFGFESDLRPLLGATEEEVEANYAGYKVPGQRVLVIPKLEFGLFDNRVQYRLVSGKVAELHFILSYEISPDGKDGKAQMAQALLSKFGSPKRAKWRGSDVARYARAPFVDVLEPAKSPWFEVHVHVLPTAPAAAPDGPPR